MLLFPIKQHESQLCKWTPNWFTKQWLINRWLSLLITLLNHQPLWSTTNSNLINHYHQPQWFSVKSHQLLISMIDHQPLWWTINSYKLQFDSLRLFNINGLSNSQVVITLVISNGLSINLCDSIWLINQFTNGLTNGNTTSTALGSPTAVRWPR